jgi:hypothetical protein
MFDVFPGAQRLVELPVLVVTVDVEKISAIYAP